MNLKNKILLTALALLLSICIFNTDCFAFEVSDDTYGTFNIPDEVQDYYYILYGYDVDNNNKVDWYCFAVSTKPIAYGSYKPSDVNNRYAFYTDGYILATLSMSSSAETFQTQLNELTLNTSSTSTGYFHGGYQDIFDGTYYKLLFSFNNHDIVDKKTESILKEANVEINPNYEFTNGSVVKNVVRSGVGIGYINELMITDELKSGEFIKLDFGLKNNKDRIVVAIKDSRKTSNAVLKIAEMIKEIFTKDVTEIRKM